MYGWMDFGGWSPARLLHVGLNSGLMCNPGREVMRKDFGWEYDWEGDKFIIYMIKQLFQFFGRQTLEFAKQCCLFIFTFI
jgi:hypothetical protein